MNRILITGSRGQIGTKLNNFLTKVSPISTIFELDPSLDSKQDVTCLKSLEECISTNQITTVIHLASILSAKGEANPQLALKVNQQGTENILEMARKYGLKLFIPSSIAIHGKEINNFLYLSLDFKSFIRLRQI